MFVLSVRRLVAYCPIYKQADANDTKKNIEEIHLNPGYSIHDRVENAEGE